MTDPEYSRWHDILKVMDILGYAKVDDRTWRMMMYKFCNGLTLDETAKFCEIKITRERVRQLIKKVLKKLKSKVRKQ
jgi:DNA-directed RNA polymerase specialized sigma subunit